MNEWLEANAPPLILAMMGGIADFLMSDDHSLTNMFVGIFLAGFSGYLVLLLCVEWNVSESWTGITCGIAGMSSRVVLQVFKRVVLEKIRWYVKLPDDDLMDKMDQDPKKQNNKQVF